MYTLTLARATKLSPQKSLTPITQPHTTTQVLFILPDDINYTDQQPTEIHQSTKHGSLTTNNNNK